MRDQVEAKRDQLRKEKAEFVNAIQFMEGSLAQHRAGLERIDGALVVVEGLLAAPLPTTEPAEEVNANPSYEGQEPVEFTVRNGFQYPQEADDISAEPAA